MVQGKKIASLVLVSSFAMFFVPVSVHGALRDVFDFFRPVPVRHYVLGGKSALWEGDSLDQWTDTKGKSPGKGWVLEDGTLTRKSSAGDMITKKDYEYYVLEFDWIISPKGNGGVKYRARKYGNHYLGCEYQILDDFQAGGEKNLTGSLYDICPPGENKKMNPAGEVNHSKIVVFGNRIEHWLNGEKIVHVYTGNRDWKKRVQKSKFKDEKGFGENRFGKILIQDHGNEVRFKNMTIREYVPVKPERGLRTSIWRRLR